MSPYTIRNASGKMFFFLIFSWRKIIFHNNFFRIGLDSALCYCILDRRRRKKQNANKTYDIDAKPMRSKGVKINSNRDILVHALKFKFTFVMKNATKRCDFLFKYIYVFISNINLWELFFF